MYYKGQKSHYLIEEIFNKFMFKMEETDTTKFLDWVAQLVSYLSAVLCKIQQRESLIAHFTMQEFLDIHHNPAIAPFLAIE